MPEQYDNSNRGVLFKKEKEKETQPDYSGNVEPVCAKCGQKTDFWLSAWVQNMKSTGEKYFSLALTVKDSGYTKKGGSDTPKMATPKPAASDAELDDDLPF